jgi:hypothetical protein
MSLNHLSLLLSAISVLLGLTGIVLPILFAIFGVLAGLIVLALLSAWRSAQEERPAYSDAGLRDGRRPSLV